LGADDYICKPFEPEELVLRIQNILKRTGKTDQDMIVLGKFLFYPGKLQLTGYEKSYRLTQKEAELLNLLVVNNGVILKREDILVELWGEDDYFLGRSLDVFIRNPLGRCWMDSQGGGKMHRNPTRHGTECA